MYIYIYICVCVCVCVFVCLFVFCQEYLLPLFDTLGVRHLNATAFFSHPGSFSSLLATFSA